MLLLSPPLFKPSEPPPALANLAGTLRSHGVACHICDLNIEAVHWLLQQPCRANDTWSRRAGKNMAANLQRLSDLRTYTNISRYKRAVADLNRLLETAGRADGTQISLSNYQTPQFSPTRSDDLLRAADNFSSSIIFPFLQERLDQLLQTSGAKVVGLSLNFLSQAVIGFQILGYLRKTYPGVTLVAGGGLVTTWLSNPEFRNPFGGLLDHLVGGPGEDFLLELAAKPPTPSRFLPDFSTLADNHYLAPGFILPYCGSFGCFWSKCSFCPERCEKTPFRMVSPETTCSDLQELSRIYKPRLIHLVDNAIPPATLKALVRQPPGVPWYGFARFDRPLLDKSFCLALKQSGCAMLKLGLESGDQNVLDALHKGIKLEKVSVVLKNLAEAQIPTYVYLLFGTPAEEQDGAERTLCFVDRHHAGISFANLAIFNLPIHSPEAATLVTSRFSEGDLSLYADFRHPHNWHRSQVRRWLDGRFKKNPYIKAMLTNDPPFFTSNHAPLFRLAAAEESNPGLSAENFRHR